MIFLWCVFVDFVFVLDENRPLTSERFDSPKPAPTSLFSPARETPTPFNDEPLSNARRRAERVITEDAFFDSRGARVPKNTIGEAIREFDDEVGTRGRNSLACIHIYLQYLSVYPDLSVIFNFNCQKQIFVNL